MFSRINEIICSSFQSFSLQPILLGGGADEIDLNIKLEIAKEAKSYETLGQQWLKLANELRGSHWPCELLQGRAKAWNCQRARPLVNRRRRQGSTGTIGGAPPPRSWLLQQIWWGYRLWEWVSTRHGVCSCVWERECACTISRKIAWFGGHFTLLSYHTSS